MSGLSNAFRGKGRRRATGQWLGLALLGGIICAGPSARAVGDCSIEAHGQAAYDRVTQKVRENLKNIEQFDFEPYQDIQVSLEADCVLVLHGRVTFKKQRNQESRVYDARVTPQAGAPGGIKIIKLRLSRNWQGVQCRGRAILAHCPAEVYLNPAQNRWMRWQASSSTSSEVA